MPTLNAVGSLAQAFEVQGESVGVDDDHDIGNNSNSNNGNSKTKAGGEREKEKENEADSGFSSFRRKLRVAVNVDAGELESLCSLLGVQVSVGSSFVLL